MFTSGTMGVDPQMYKEWTATTNGSGVINFTYTGGIYQQVPGVFPINPVAGYSYEVTNRTTSGCTVTVTQKVTTSILGFIVLTTTVAGVASLGVTIGVVGP